MSCGVCPVEDTRRSSPRSSTPSPRPRIAPRPLLTVSRVVQVLELAPAVSVLDGRRVDRDPAQPQGQAEADPGAGKTGDGEEEEPTEQRGRPEGEKEETPQERTAKRKSGHPKGGKDSERNGGVAEDGSRHGRDAGLRESRSAKEAGVAQPNGKRKRGPSADAVEPARMAEGEPVPASGDRAGEADKSERKGGPPRQGGEGTGKRQKRKADKLSAKETGVVNVVLHSDKGGGKGQGKKQRGAPLAPAAQPLGVALEVGLGDGGPSSWG